MINKLLDLIKIKPVRYISKEFIIEKYDQRFYDELLTRTAFLKESSNLSERIFCIVSGITSNSICMHCGKELESNYHNFEMSSHKYKFRFCNEYCLKNFKNDMTIPHRDVENYNEGIILDLIKTKTMMDICKNPEYVNLIKVYLHAKGIDYRSLTDKEAFYFVQNGLTDVPKCVCGKKLPYLWKGKYRDYCSKDCKKLDKKWIEKRICTNRERYGVDNVFQVQKTKDKTKQTFLDRYGVTNPMKLDEFKNKIHKEELITKQRREGFKRIIALTDITPLFTFDEYKGNNYTVYYDWKCNKCGLIFNHWWFGAAPPKCPDCNKNNKISEVHQQIIDLLKNYNINIEINTRKIIPPLELDIYIPDKKIGIEVNGLYYHCENKSGKDHKYHLNKTDLSRTHDIKLIQIFDDEIRFKWPIVRNRLKHILRLTKYRIFGRKCLIQEIDSTRKNEFLDKYHIQGKDKSNIHLGAFYKNRLIAVMTFGKLRKALGSSHVEGSWELSRFCTVGNFNCIGIADKLLKHFERMYNPISIVSYADRRWSNGDLYHKLNFTLDHTSKPSYWYTQKYDIRQYRYGFRKSELSKKLEIFDPLLSEWDNMKNNGYDRVWDCGSLVFHKNFHK